MIRLEISNRIKWIDYAKAITIILVIIAHTISDNNIIKPLIFSFHMPLFFICSGITMRCSHNFKEFMIRIKKDCLSLLLPAVVIYFFKVVIELLLNYEKIFASGILLFAKKKIITLFFASGVEGVFFGYRVPQLGMLWFLFALFFAKVIYDFLQMVLNKKVLIIVCLLLSALGILVGERAYCPFSIDISIATLVFILLGQEIKIKMYRGKRWSYLVLIVAFVIWISVFIATYITYHLYLQLAVRIYPGNILCYIVAIAGCFMIFELCKIRGDGKSNKIVTLLGMNSLLLYLIHALDYLWRALYTVGNEFVNALIRVILDLALFSIILVTYYLIKKVFLKDNREMVKEER